MTRTRDRRVGGEGKRVRVDPAFEGEVLRDGEGGDDAGCEALTRKQREVRFFVRREVRRRWPNGVIPATEGGRFFRMLAGQLGCPEYVFSKLGKEEGWWPWTPREVARAFGRRHERAVRRAVASRF